MCCARFVVSPMVGQPKLARVSRESVAGKLPGITITRGWLREPQRFPVLVEFDGDESKGLRRIGGQADVIVYTGSGNPLNLLGAALIRSVSLLSYLH